MTHHAKPTITIPKSLIARYIPDEPRIIEAGAHIGRDTVAMIAQWPAATIHCFEPIMTSYNKLIANLTPHGNIVACNDITIASIPRADQAHQNKNHAATLYCYPYALAAANGRATLYQGNDKLVAASSLLQPATYWHERPYATFTPTLINTITLADFARIRGLDAIDFLWLDLQGAELGVLQTAGPLLDTVKAIHTEVNLIARYHGSCLYPELSAWLTKNGFCLAHEALNNHGWGNALFVRADNIKLR